MPSLAVRSKLNARDVDNTCWQDLLRQQQQPEQQVENGGSSGGRGQEHWELLEVVDFSRLAKMFSNTNAKKKGAGVGGRRAGGSKGGEGGGGGGGVEKKTLVKLVDPKRAYGIDIGLAHFRMSHSAIRDCIVQLDEHTLTPEVGFSLSLSLLVAGIVAACWVSTFGGLLAAVDQRVGQLINYVPTAEELSTINNYTSEGKAAAVAAEPSRFCLHD